MFPKLAAALFTLMLLAFPSGGQALAPAGFVCGVTNEFTPVKADASVAAPGVARTGARSVLVIRVDFTNAPGTTISETQAIVQLGAVDAFFRSTSFQQLSLPVVAVTPLLRLPGNASVYAGHLAELTEQGRLAAEAAGFPSAAYDFVIYSFPTIGAPFTAIAQVNGKGVWVQGDNFKGPILAHELGHNLGLPHANAWVTPDDSIAGFGYVIDYANPWDLMGNSSFGLSAEYNANFRYLLGWLHDTDIHVATASGVYRIFAIDAAQPLDVSKRFALRVPASLTLAGLPHDYWIDARQANHDRTADGVVLKAGAAQLDYSGNLLLDTTPGSLGGLADSALVLGRTYADFDRSIFITPINRGSKDDNVFYDVEVNLGVTNNQNPEVTISASILATNTSHQITFGANATDPDGDELSYFWDFGDETIASKLDKATVSKSWSQRGAYRVQCTVSDRKGGFASRSLVVQIGTSPNFMVSGQARVGKKLLGGVRVHNGRPGIENRYAFTDSDGSYTLTELPAGTHTLQAVKAGLNFDLVTVGVGPSATNIDLLALPAVEPFITAISPDHGEPGTTVSISGVNFSGTAAVRFGEVSAAFVVNSSTKITATVPAGNFTANISVTTARGSDTNSQAFTIDVPQPPFITAFVPGHGQPGSTVTISGLNLARVTSVSFGGVNATFTVVSSTVLTTIVPSSAATTAITVTTPGGTATSAEAFVVDEVPPPPALPSIASFSPSHGEPGSIVTISGTNFSGVTAVRFGGANAAFTVASSTMVTAIVPTGAFTATLSVTTTNGSAASSSAFVVDPVLLPPLAPLITGWIPRHGEPGTSVLISGTNFSSTTDVRFGGVNAAFTVISSTAITTIVPTGASTARFSITTTNGSAASTEAFVIDDPQPVALIAQPQNMALAEGSNGVFVVTVSGTGPLGFQWRKDGTNIPGATASSLAITNARLENEGSYSVMVTNPLGSLVSTTALLTVLTLGRAVEQPALTWSTSIEAPWFGQTNVWLDDGSSGPDGSIETGGGAGPVRGYSAQSGGQTNDSWIEATVSGPLLLSFWWQLSARFFDETLDFSVDGLRQTQIKGARNWSQYSIPLSDGPHALRWTQHARQPGTSGWLDQIHTTSNWFTSQPQGTNILAGDALNLAATAGSPANFQWERDGLLLADATNSTLHLPSITPAEEGDYRVIISYNGTSVTSVVAHVTVKPLAITLPPADQNVIATSNALFRVGFVSRLPAHAQWLFNAQPIPGATNQILTFRAMPTNAGPYRVVVANIYGALTSAPAALFVDSGPPSILSTDSNYLAYAGEKVILQMPLSSAPPPTYRWMHNRRAVRGATNAALVFPRIQRVQAGDYFLIAQNPFGAITQRIHVIVRSLVIKQQPVSQEVFVEDPLPLSMEAGNAAGFGPLKYQWRFNGISVPGATNRTLLFPSAQVPQSGDYDVVVRARLGQPRLTSSVAHVTVTGSPPVFDLEPQNQQRQIRESTRFTTLASGRPAPSYQWYFNETPLPAARRPTLTISPVETDSTGAYFVIASNQFGSATSQLAQLVVLEGSPHVRISPGDFAAIAGDFIVLREINGVSPPATNYQWTFQAPGLEATNLPGATNSVFIIPAITGAQAGKYRLLARNALGEDLSSGTDIEVRPPLALDLWQWNSPLPRGDDLLGAAFGHGTFLAVGAAGSQIRATNTVSWIDHSFLTKDEVSSAVFATDRFMILLSEKNVEQNDGGAVLLVSTNALDWFPAVQPNVDTIQNLRAANGRFFAAGGDVLGGLVICVSEDGSGWSQSPIPLPRNKLSVAYGAGQYVALSGPQIILSSDATNWDLGPLLGDARDLCFGNGTFVAVGSVGQVWSSTNGLNWTSRLSGTGKDLFVAGFGKNRFFGAGEDGKLITSTDGANWSSVNSHTSRDLYAFSASDEQIALVGAAGAIVSSSNGILWLEHSQAATTDDLLEVIFTNNTFVAIGDSGTILRSTNGLAWTAQNAGTGKDLNSIASAPNGFVAVGEDGKILTSPDARVWTAQASPGDKSLRRVAYLNDLYVAVGDDGAIVTSTNGTQWSARSTTLPGPGTLEGIAYGNGLFIAVGGYTDPDGFAASVIITSPDGVTWTTQTPNFSKKLRNITFANGQFIGVGNDGLVAHSEDGLTWRQQLIANPLENLRALHALPGLLVIVGNDGVVFSSPDGDTWKRHRSFTSKNLHSAAFGQNKLVAVGGDGAILQSDGILPVLDAQRLPDGMQFSIKGGAGDRYWLQVSEDAIAWRNAVIMTNGLPGLLRTNDCNSTCHFFRLRSF